MRMSHSPRTPKPRGPRLPRSNGGRLTALVLGIVAVAFATTLTLALAASWILTSSGGSPRRGSPALVATAGEHTSRGAREDRPAPRARGPAGARAPVTGSPVRGAPVSVSLATRPAGSPVPADFLGLSFELRSLPALAGYAGRGDLVTLLRSLGPGMLRLGGVSADEEVAWTEGPPAGGREALPRWASVAITPHDLAGLAALARASGWRVLLTVNLGHYDPAAAAGEAAAAHSALGPYLAGIELGNEPDRYAGKRLRAPGWDFADYRAQAADYRAAIEAAAPGVPIAGPDPATGAPGLAWLRAAARTLHPALLTDHYYPLSSCGYRPTIGELLSPDVRRKESEMLARANTIARAASTPLRMDEVGSISCEGFPGVSDTFAAALWALEYTARALASGVAGINFHDLPAKRDAYSPLIAASPSALAAGSLQAAPEWYALLGARELTGSRTLPTSVAGATPGALGASAFLARDGRLRLVLVDYDPPGSRPLAVRLRISATARYAGGSVLRLTGPSPAATAGIRLGGRAVSSSGRWSPQPGLPAVYAHAGRLSVQIAASSAAVVTLYPG
jgi:hypothetical protein